MFENKLISKTNLILISTCTSVAFFGGRKSVSQIPAEIKIEKTIDTKVAKKTVALELKKNNSRFTQKKIKDTIKLPDGTIKTHEEIANVRISEETSQISKKTDLDIKTKETQTIELKTTLNKFAFELQGEVKNPVTSFSAIPEFDPELSLEAALSYRVNNNLWSFAKIEHEVLNNNNFISIGAAYRLEF